MTAPCVSRLPEPFLSGRTISAATLPERPIPRLLSEPQPSEFEVQLRQATMTVKTLGEEPTWLYRTLDAMRQVSHLPQNWSSYGSRQVEDVALVRATQFLAGIMQLQTAAPSVVPTLTGGVTLAWHRAADDVEVEFAPDGGLSYVYAYDRPSDSSWEAEALTVADRERLRTIINRADGQ